MMARMTIALDSNVVSNGSGGNSVGARSGQEYTKVDHRIKTVFNFNLTRLAIVLRIISVVSLKERHIKVNPSTFCSSKIIFE